MGQHKQILPVTCLRASYCFSLSLSLSHLLFFSWRGQAVLKIIGSLMFEDYLYNVYTHNMGPYVTYTSDEK